MDKFLGGATSSSWAAPSSSSSGGAQKRPLTATIDIAAEYAAQAAQEARVGGPSGRGADNIINLVDDSDDHTRSSPLATLDEDEARPQKQKKKKRAHVVAGGRVSLRTATLGVLAIVAGGAALFGVAQWASPSKAAGLMRGVTGLIGLPGPGAGPGLGSETLTVVALGGRLHTRRLPWAGPCTAEVRQAGAHSCTSRQHTQTHPRERHKT